MIQWIVLSTLLVFFTQGVGARVFNNPYPANESQQKIYYSSFSEQPKTFDPARSYASNEYLFIMQIYEPLLQYDYLARPYQLIPLVAAGMPEVRYLKPDDDRSTAIYTIHIKPGIFFQPHPALAKDSQGQYRYLNLPSNYLLQHNINKLSDFPFTGTRELTVDDYIYQIKRMANPETNSSIYGLMSEHILGFREYGDSLPGRKKGREFMDLRKYPLSGLRKIDDYTFEISLKGKYTQFLFWLAMPFFAPIPWEADRFYAQKGMAEKNLSFDWYPIGTGPFMLTENNPNRRIVLAKTQIFAKTIFPPKEVPAILRTVICNMRANCCRSLTKRFTRWKKNQFRGEINFYRVIMIYQGSLPIVLIKRSTSITQASPP